MKISHLTHISKPNSIVVRNYDNRSIVHYPQVTNSSVKLEHEVGVWQIKYKNEVPKEYSEVIEFDKI
jgi:hypothetical protein